MLFVVEAEIQLTNEIYADPRGICPVPRDPSIKSSFLVPAFRPVDDLQPEQRSGGFICGHKQTNLISTSFAASLPSEIT